MSRSTQVAAFDGRFYTPPEVIARLQITLDALQTLARKGQFPGAVKVGGQWRIHAAPFEAWTRGWWTPNLDDDGAWVDDWDEWQAALVAANNPEL